MNTMYAPSRTPSFVVFSKPDVYYGYSGSTDGSKNSAYLWNHGTISPDILDIWAGFVGPGVNAGKTSAQWMDHADTIPTIYSLLGYSESGNQFDGVPVQSVLANGGSTGRVAAANATLTAAEEVYKQLNAPVGTFGMAMLKLSTEASTNATNQVGASLDSRITSLTKQRDAVAARLQSDIFASMQHQSLASHLAKDVADAQALLNQVNETATY